MCSLENILRLLIDVYILINIDFNKIKYIFLINNFRLCTYINGLLSNLIIVYNLVYNFDKLVFLVNNNLKHK